MTQWISVARVGDIEPGGMLGVKVDELRVVVYHLESGFYATSGLCTHMPVLLQCGFLRDGMVVCGVHGAAFDIETGKSRGMGLASLETYPVRLVDGDIQIALPDAG